MHAAASVLELGFLLGLRHATDADHVLAVSTIVARERRLWAASLVGMLWGLGHTVTVLVVGGAIVWFKLLIPPRIGLGLELAVAAMLVALGTVNLRRSASPSLGGTLPARRVAVGRGRPFAVGVVHGLAGSAAVALLVLSTIGESPLAVAYLVIFGVGTIAGMALLTTAVAFPFAFAAGRFERVNRSLTQLTGLASLLFGVFIAYELVLVHGLFSVAPTWTPG